MNNNNPSLITSIVLSLALAYIYGMSVSEVFVNFTRVFHENIETVLMIVLIMFVALYYFRIYGIITETFCGADNPSQEDEWCQSLKSGKNCTTASCCVLLNGSKCVGGTSKGPTFLTRNGKNVDFDYFEYKSRDDGTVKCRGKCPDSE